MKLLLVASLFLLLEAAEVNMIAMEKFKEFIVKYKKAYNGTEQFQKRFEIFVESLKKIEKFTKDANGMTSFGINEYSDWTWEEFKKQKLVGLPANLGRSNNFTAPIRLDALPDNWDWRLSGIVTPVKNQGGCGSCWSFATVAVVEAMAAKAGRGRNSYAEQQMIDCVDDGCNGGNFQHAFGYSKDQGLPFESDYPYRASRGQCHDAPIRIKLSGMNEVNRNENDMAWSVHDGGPMAVFMLVGESFQHYSGGIFTSNDCHNNGGGHAVTVVGFGTDSGYRYWITKNSWGSSWGEKGFFRSPRGINWCEWTHEPVAGWV